MLVPSPPALERALGRVRERGEPVSLAELARELLALRAPVPTAVARRLVAAALGHEPGALPERLPPEALRPAPEAAVAGVPLEAADLVVVDLETTGLAVGRCSILEIGAVRIARLAPVDRFETLVRPPQRVPDAIVALTGIDDAAVADAPPSRTALRAFRRWLSRTPTAPFTAHNAAFDARFVARGFADCALPAYAVPVLCTRRLGRRLLPRLGRYDLDHLCAHFGIRNRARHRAFGDAEATSRLLVELLSIARDGRVSTVGELLDLQARPVRRRRSRGRRR